MNYRLNRLRNQKRRNDETWFDRHQGLTALLVALIFFTGLGLAGEWDIQDREVSERLAASVWEREEGHFSGEESHE